MDKIMIIFCILTIYVNSVVSKDGQDDLPPFQPRIEDLQLPLFPTEARQISGSELSNGKISQQKPAQALAPIVNGGNENVMKNKTNVISVVDFPSSFDADFDSDVEDSSEDNTKATADLADVTSQPQHMTNSKNLSPDRTTVSPKEEDDSDKDDLFNDEDTYSEEDEEDKADYMEEKADKDDDKDEADAQKEYDRSDDDDDDDEEYEVTQWTQYDYLDKDSELDNEKDGDAKEFDETNDDFGGETDEVIGKSQLPTAPYNKLLFYTWIIVAVLIVIVVISTYRSHCRGFRFPGMKMTRDQREDKKQLIKHETV